MRTECSGKPLHFKKLGRRDVVADFEGGEISSDAGALLLRAVDERLGVLDRFAACFQDHRNPDAIEHSVRSLLAQRVFGIALGWEDLNDHDELSWDPLLATVVGKVDPTGQDRIREQDKGRALAGKSTLNRLELTPSEATGSARYKKIVADFDAIEDLFVELFLDRYEEAPEEIVLDFDATDDPLYGRQEGRFFHGYYGSYCYLPLYVFCDNHLLVAQLRESGIDASEGTVEVLQRLVPAIRERWPEVRVIVRGDSGFAREGIMSWCEGHGVDYVFGLAKNARLIREIESEVAEAQVQWEGTGRGARVFKEFRYATLKTWSRERRVIAKAEYLAKGPNPRFIATSLAGKSWAPQRLYEDMFCARGEMENRIKEQQLYLFADRTSTAKMRSNQLRLWFSSMAYVLMDGLRRLALKGTRLARARCDTIRLKLLKIGAQVKVSVRRVWVSLSSSFPNQDVFVHVWERLQCLPMRC